MVETILVLDAAEAGESDLVDALRELFPKARLETTPDQAAFEAALAAKTPDLAAIRLTLSGVNEFAAVERCREASAGMRIVLSAASAPESLRSRAADLGCAMTASPVTADKVLAAIDTCAAERARAACNAAAAVFS